MFRLEKFGQFYYAYYLTEGKTYSVVRSYCPYEALDELTDLLLWKESL